LVAGKGEEFFDTRGGEVHLVFEANLDKASVTELLPQMPPVRFALASEFEDLPTQHEGQWADVILFVHFNPVVPVTARLPAFSAADFEVFEFKVGSAIWVFVGMLGFIGGSDFIHCIGDSVFAKQVVPHNTMSSRPFFANFYPVASSTWFKYCL